MKNMEVSRRHRKSKLKLPSKSESDPDATSKRHERRKKKLRLEKRSSSEGVRAKHERKVSRSKTRSEPQCSHGGIGITLIDALEISWERQAKYLGDLMEDGLSDPKATFHPWSCLAEVALVHYHKEQGIELDLVKMVKENGKLSRLEPGAYHHIFFKAVPKNVDWPDLPPQLFFAEIFDCGVKLHPTCCFIIKPYEDPVKEKRKHGCAICPDDEEFPHPTTGFLSGRFPFVEV